MINNSNVINNSNIINNDLKNYNVKKYFYKISKHGRNYSNKPQPKKLRSSNSLI